MVSYPSDLDDSLSIPIIVNNISSVNAESVNPLRDAILAIESELGINPSGVFGNVKDRLDNFDATIANLEPSSGSGGGAPTGSAGGDLSSTYPNPTVTDLTIASEAKGSILYYNGSNWVQLSPSTDGYVLTTHSTGQDPTWTFKTPLTSSAPSDVDTSAASVGVINQAARSDHKHDITTAAASSTGAANAEGSASSLARSDHTHAVSDLAITSQTQGSILYYNGSNWVRLSPGSDGYVLMTHSTGQNPTWSILPEDTDITISDNATSALLVHEGAQKYIEVSTSDIAPAIKFGNTTTNPIFSLLGSGLTSIGGALTTANALTVSADGANITGGLTVATGNVGVSAGDVSLTKLGADPGGTSNIGKIYTKDVGSTTALYFQDSASSVYQLTTPGVGAESIVVLASDVASTTSATLIDVTGLSFSVTTGHTYSFKFLIPYSSAATTTGSWWSVNGPTATLLSLYTSVGFTNNGGAGSPGNPYITFQNAYGGGSQAAQQSIFTTGNLATIEGIVTVSASGTLIARFSTEVNTSAITAKAGAFVSYRQLI